MLIAICDDEPQELEALEKAIVHAASVLSAEIEIAAYPSGKTLMEAVESGIRPDLAVMDIYMDGLSGMDTARSLRRSLPNLHLAFLSISREFAVDAFELEALHYMVKPVTDEKALSLLQRFFAKTRRPPLLLRLTSGRRERQFPLELIRYVLSRDRGVELYLQNRSRPEWVSSLFRQAAEQLTTERDFLQISRSCIVNMNDISYLGHSNCHMKGGETLSISRRGRQSVQTHYNDFLFRRMDLLKRKLP